MAFAELVAQRKAQQPDEEQIEQGGSFSSLVEQRRVQLSPQTQEITLDDPSMFSQLGTVISDMFTGDDRQTDAIQGLPEFDLPLIDPSKGFIENAKRQVPLARSAMGLLTTFDPKRQANVLKDNFPDLQFFQDEQGNIIVDGSAHGGGLGVLNLPGLSGRDLIQAGFQVAAFTPAAKAGQLATTVLGKAGAVGAASGVTQAGQDLIGQSTGSSDFDVTQATEGVTSGNAVPLDLTDLNKGVLPRLGDIDKSDVLLAGVAGGTFEGIFSGLAKLAPVLRQKFNTSGVTDDIRAVFKQEAIRLGRNPDEISDKVIASFLRSSDEAVDPVQAASLQGEREFGISLTKGQRSGVQKDISFEDSGRSGFFGGKVQDKFLTKGAEQNRQIDVARQGIQRGLAKGDAPISSQQEAGSLISQGVRQAELAADDAVRASFDSVGDASLSGEGYMKLLNAVKDSVKSPEFVKSKTLAPASAELLEKVNKFVDVVGAQAKEIKPQHIRQIELMRRTIGSHIKAAANPSDKRTLTTIKNAFDDYLDRAMQKALFSGDQAALDSLKSSRSLFKDYAKKFRSQPVKTPSGRTIPDKEGNFIETIISGNPTDEQVVNSLFGAGNTFGNKAGKNMAVKMKSILGEKSQEWNSVRQAAFMRIFKPDRSGVISGTNTIKNINSAMEGNASLMKEIFDPQEIGLFRRFATHIKRTQPDIVRSVENPAGTAQKATKAAKEMIGRMMQAMGIASGNPLLTISGAGVQVGTSFKASSRAAKAVRPFQSRIQLGTTPDLLISGGTAGAVAAGN